MARPAVIVWTALGNQWVLPRIQDNPVFKVTVAVPVWINIAVPAGMLALTGLAALVPAVRAGRLSAVQTITAGQAPRGGHGHAAHRLADKLPLPRPVTAGLAAPFARPARSAATLAAITVGLTAAVLAVGLDSQITKVVLSIGVAYEDRGIFQRLRWLVIVLAGIGVFSTLLMQGRERVRDLGIYKALGMTPRQVITMVTCWAIVPAIIAAAIALPAGVVMEPVVARAVVSAQAGAAENMARFMPRGPGGTGSPGEALPSSGAVRYASPPAGPQPGVSGEAMRSAPRGTSNPSARGRMRQAGEALASVQSWQAA